MFPQKKTPDIHKSGAIIPLQASLPENYRDLNGLVKLNAFGRAAFGCFFADILELGRNFIYDYLSYIAIHLENLRAKIDTNLVSGTEIFVY